MSEKRYLFKKNLIKSLYFGGTLSSADLSAIAQKNLQITSKAINELVNEGSVLAAGYAHSTGGRCPQLFSLKPDLMYVVAVAMDQLTTRISLLNMENNFVGEIRELDFILSNRPKLIIELAEHLNQFILDSGIPKNKIAGIGIGMPGFVDSEKGINHSFLKVQEGSIVSILEKITKLPVSIDNDSSLIALAEFKIGAAQGKQNVMVVNIGWGIGLGMILNKKLYRGNDGLAGELSHIPLFTNNKICSCGKMGCLETETSLLVVVEKAMRGLSQGKPSILKNLNPENIEEAAELILNAAIQGDTFAVELISEAGYNIGRGIAILVHILNPKTIILSGRGSVGGKLWTTPIQQALNEHCIPKIAENLNTEISTLGSLAELYGAAALVMEHYDKVHPKTKTSNTLIQINN
ncbi:ROK family protein [Daejeonella sp.]|jgi:predicted NBD/HSP70 family sugar kinase|uniref:ROK family protein n=1 Tax=Daejeonella sp. TaxID=2805397 RepID=UPI0037C079FD